MCKATGAAQDCTSMQGIVHALTILHLQGSRQETLPKESPLLGVRNARNRNPHP